MLSDELMAMKITDIVIIVSRRLHVDYERALGIFYNSDTSEHLHNEATGLYLMGDLFIVDELMRELQDKQGW